MDDKDSEENTNTEQNNGLIEKSNDATENGNRMIEKPSIDKVIPNKSEQNQTNSL